MFAYGILWLNALFIPGKELGRTEGLLVGVSMTPYPAGAVLIAKEQQRLQSTKSKAKVASLATLELMQKLLCKQPHLRPTTAQLLADAHFLPPAQDDSQLPKGWTPMPGAHDNYRLCELSDTDGEFRTISANFLRSAGRSKILRIERVQNRYLWAAFRHERKQLERKHGQAPVERQLWCEPTLGRPVRARLLPLTLTLCACVQARHARG
eukprot:COSAG04_NODE_1038_length_8607_cov_2.977433_9_plen_209_part_00